MLGESLKKLNSFGVDVYAYNFYTIQSYNDIIDFLKKDTTQRSRIMVLGSGSNILFTKNSNAWFRVITEANQSLI